MKWQTVSSIGVVGSFSLVIYLTMAVMAAQATGVSRTYTWIGRVVSSDATARTVTMSVRCKEHIARYIDRFKPGERVVLYWGMPEEGGAQAITYIGEYDLAATARPDDHGYVLPVEFLSFDRSNSALTFKAFLDRRTFDRLPSVRPEQRLRVTSPLNQSGKGIAAIAAIEVLEESNGS